MGYSKSVISRVVVDNAVNALSSSYALTASYALNATKGNGSFSGSFSGSFTGSLFGTSSWAYSASQSTTASYVTGSIFTSTNPALSASYALTASYALNGGSGGSTFPYTGSAIISGSLILTGSFYLSQSLTYFASVSPTIPGDNTLYFFNTGSYRSAFGKYTIYSGSNARAGEFVIVWNDGTVRYFDNSTTDIGDTSNMIFYSSITSGQILIQVGGGADWTVKMLTTFI